MVHVRKAGREDLVEIHKLLMSIFPNAAAKLNRTDEFFIAIEGSEVIGFAHFFEDEEKIVLKGFGVAEKSRRKGVGGAILERLIAHAQKEKKKIFLKTKLGNPAVRLYCVKGFIMKRLKGETLTMVYRPAN